MPVGHYGAAKRRRLGLAYTPEERLKKGVVPNLSLLENALLTGYGQGLVRGGMIRKPDYKPGLAEFVTYSMLNKRVYRTNC